MKAPLIVDALRARDPGAPAALYDTHGESLFRYCWFILRNRDAAQVALRDTLVVAEAHISQLHAPEMLRPWLYALARAECMRRQQSRGAAHDTVIARPDQPDADRRLIAWHAVMSLDATEREALELTIRQGFDARHAALVLGIQPAEMPGILERGAEHLEQALAGEILARHGVHGCPERAEALQGWAGELTVPLRERLVQHAGACQVCSRYLPRNVSATKVFSLLPVPVPPQAMRLRVMTCFSDPELVGYRMFVAARVTDFDQFGFPGEEAAPPPPPRRGGARAVWSGPAAAAVAVAVLVVAVFAISRLGGFTTAVQGVSSATNSGPAATAPTVTVRPSGTSPGSASAPGHQPTGGSPSPAGAVLGTIRGAAATTRLYLRGSSAPVPYLPPAPSPSHPGTGHSSSPAGTLQISPTQLNLGTGSTGQITLAASGGPVTWSAGTTSPDITLSSSDGTLAAGQQAVITVNVSRNQNASGQATIMIGPGDVAVTISWSAPVTSPPPPPPTSPSPTVLPSSPSPTPSSPTPSLTPTSPTRLSPSPTRLSPSPSSPSSGS